MASGFASTYISYSDVYVGTATPVTYVDATVGTIGILTSRASYFAGVQIPVVGEAVAVYGGVRITWDVFPTLGYCMAQASGMAKTITNGLDKGNEYLLFDLVRRYSEHKEASSA